MTKTTKAVLLSALVFPGCGHLMLKSKLIAGLLISTSLGCLYFIVARTMEIANDISAKILSGEIPLDVGKITEAVSAASSSSDSLQITVATWVSIICWGIGIADSYRLANKTHDGPF